MNLVLSLQRLFPTHPYRHVKLYSTGTAPGEKGVTTVHKQALEEDYARHLSVKSTPGPGALGVVLGRPIGVDGSWVVSSVALDYDHVDYVTLSRSLGETLDALSCLHVCDQRDNR